jgi:hypothetical protein
MNLLSNKAALTLFWDLNARNHEVTLLKIKHIRLKEKYGWAKIHEMITDFVTHAKPSQTLLFYFSGRGIPKSNEVYLSTSKLILEDLLPHGF